MDSNRSSSGPEGTTVSVEGVTSIVPIAKSATELPGREAKTGCTIVTAPSLGPQGDATKSLEASSQRLSISGISMQTRPKARQKSNQNEHPLRERITVNYPRNNWV